MVLLLKQGSCNQKTKSTLKVYQKKPKKIKMKEEWKEWIVFEKKDIYIVIFPIKSKETKKNLQKNLPSDF